jgi:hypothetical protein
MKRQWLVLIGHHQAEVGSPTTGLHSICTDTSYTEANATAQAAAVPWRRLWRVLENFLPSNSPSSSNITGRDKIGIESLFSWHSRMTNLGCG